MPRPPCWHQGCTADTRLKAHVVMRVNDDSIPFVVDYALCTCYAHANELKSPATVITPLSWTKLCAMFQSARGERPDRALTTIRLYPLEYP